MSGLRIGHYEVLSTIGRGSIGVVYKARDPRLNRTVAIKALKSVFLGDNSSDNIELQRFYRESQTAGSLRHPNIITIFDVGCTELGSPYIVMEYIEGMTLAEIIDARAPLKPAEVLRILIPIADAIDYAHSHGIFHRDVTPSNMIIDSEGRPFILDFSLAKMLNASITPTGTMLGSPGYMAPELVSGKTFDKTIDVFSLAAVTFEMLTGGNPFPGDDLIRITHAVMNEEPKTAQDFGVTLPEDAEAAIKKGMAKDRTQRFQTCSEFIKALEKGFSLGMMETQTLPTFQEAKQAAAKRSTSNNLTIANHPKLSKADLKKAEPAVEIKKEKSEPPKPLGKAKTRLPSIEEQLDLPAQPKPKLGSAFKDKPQVVPTKDEKVATDKKAANNPLDPFVWSEPDGDEVSFLPGGPKRSKKEKKSYNSVLLFINIVLIGVVAGLGFALYTGVDIHSMFGGSGRAPAGSQKELSK